MIEIIKGTAKINGALYTTGEKITIHANRSYLLLCSEEDCIKPIIIQGKLREADPSEMVLINIWEENANSIISDCDSNNHCKVVIIGSTETGKTTFSELLTNLLLQKGYIPVLIDGDVGQSTIGYPGFISSKTVKYKILWERKPQSEFSFFVGNISPVKIENKIILGLLKTIEHYEKNMFKHFIIDTDGWFGDRNSMIYKTNLVLSINPTHIVCLRKNTQDCAFFESLIRKIKPSVKFLSLPSPIIKKERDIHDRKLLRGEKIFLSNMIKRVINVENTPVIGDIALGISKSLDKANDLDHLNIDQIYCEQQLDKTLVIYKGKDPQLHLPNYILLSEKHLENIIVAVVDRKDNHHFGMIQGFSPQTKSLHILTDYNGEIQYIITSNLKYKNGTIIAERI